MTGRNLHKEWIGRRQTSMPSDNVQLRIGERQGNRCGCGCGHVFDYSVDQIDCDHIVALKDGGENREANLQLLLRQHHVTKTNAEATARATANRHKAKAFKHQQSKGRGFPKSHPQNTATAPLKKRVGYFEDSTP